MSYAHRRSTVRLLERPTWIHTQFVSDALGIQCDFGYRTPLGERGQLKLQCNARLSPSVRWPWKGQREAWWQGRRTRAPNGCVTSLDGTERGGTGDDSEPHHGMRPRVEDPPPSREFFAEGTSRCNSLNVKRLSSTCLGTKRSLRKMERTIPVFLLDGRSRLWSMSPSTGYGQHLRVNEFTKRDPDMFSFLFRIYSVSFLGVYVFHLYMF